MTRRGMALAAVLLALVVVGALVAGAFQLGRLEHRTGRAGQYAAEALEAAEAGIASVLGDWNAFPQLGALAVGDSVVLAGTGLDARSGFQPTVLRLTETLYLVRSQGVRTDAAGNVLAQRMIASLARNEGSWVAPLGQRGWVQVY